jgi:hypothetical protein
MSQRAKRIKVFNLGAGSQSRCAHRSHTDIGLKTQGALFHITRIDTQRHEVRPQHHGISADLLHRPQIRRTDYLQERHTGAVIVYPGAIMLVDEFTRIFLQMHTSDADTVSASAGLHFQIAIRG